MPAGPAVRSHSSFLPQSTATFRKRRTPLLLSAKHITMFSHIAQIKSANQCTKQAAGKNVKFQHSSCSTSSSWKPYVIGPAVITVLMRTVRALEVRTSLTVTDATPATLPGQSTSSVMKIGPIRHGVVEEMHCGGDLIVEVMLGLCEWYRRYWLKEAEGS